MSGGWSVSVKSARTETLMELYELLKGDRTGALEIQKELVDRARATGMTTQEIMRTLVRGVVKKSERTAIAREWAEALGLKEAEAKRLAD
jgi:hypothetical protein